MKKFFQSLSLIILLVATGIIWTNREESRVFFTNIRRQYIDKPCTKPITYSIGTMDQRFDISREDFKDVIAKAETIWENPVGKNLFEYDPSSNLKINLVYDDRQQRTDDSEKLENKLDTIENSHDQLISRYNNINSTYKKRLDAYNKKADEYQERLDDYNSEVDSWNKQGGAPSDVYQNLKKEKNDLQDLFTELEKERKAINQLIGQSNDLANQEKNIVKDYNSNLSTYQNKYGSPSEFDKGVYDGQSINVYQYNAKDDLEMTVAHEFGHALGIDHLSQPQSLMYYLMGEQDMKNPKLSDEDLAALKSVCYIK